MRIVKSLFVLLVFGACSASPVAERGERVGSVEQAVKAPLANAFCSVKVVGKGTKATEDDYLPRVITCENGGAGFEALKAQAIAARSVAYYEMASYGDICDGQGCQVYTCATPPSELAKQAVKETNGLYLSYGAMLTYGFYVDGDPKTKGPSCVGSASYKNEKWVTYNDGLTGKDVEQTPLGYIGPPGFGQNRGCMSQWGARCLESGGANYLDILRFYYGQDIELLQAMGPCVTPIDLDADGDGIPDVEDNCPGVSNPSQSDVDGDTDGDACDLDDDNDGIPDEKDNCPSNPNPGQPDADADGVGDECDSSPQSPSDSDADLDGIPDSDDLCPTVPSSSGMDTDGDGVGDECDPDRDGDGVLNEFDDCPTIPDPAQDLGDCSTGFGFDGAAGVEASASCSASARGARHPNGSTWAALVFASFLVRARRSRTRPDGALVSRGRSEHVRGEP